MNSATRTRLLAAGITEDELPMYDLEDIIDDASGPEDFDEEDDGDEMDEGAKAARQANTAAMMQAFDKRLGEGEGEVDTYADDARASARALGEELAADSNYLEQVANKLALAEEHKPLSELDQAKQFRFYSRASQAIGYGAQEQDDAGGSQSTALSEQSELLQDEAEDLALVETGKELSELPHETQQRLYERAAREMGYR